jgi:hypothetical protein
MYMIPAIISEVNAAKLAAPAAMSFMKPIFL